MQVMESPGSSQSSPRQAKLPDVVALTGGKGGVGKTSVAVNLALTLARRGKKVLLLDADTDLANVSIVLGQYPSRTLEQAISGECEFGDVIMEACYGLHVIPGASGVERCMDMAPADARAMLEKLAAIERSYDIILIDTASGLRPTALHMIALAAMACIVITPDPASLTDAFSLLRVLQRRGYRRVPGVIVNMAAGASQAQKVYRRFSAAVERHLGLMPRYIGAIWRDEAIRQSVELQRPVATLADTDPSCRQFSMLAEQLLLHLSQRPQRRAGLAAYWHHRSRRALDTQVAPDQSGKIAVADRRDASPEQRCRVILAELDRLVSEHPGDTALQKEALAGASALLARMAGNLEVTASPPPAAYNEVDLGSQTDLLAHLQSQPDSVRVEQFLTSIIKSL